MRTLLMLPFSLLFGLTQAHGQAPWHGSYVIWGSRDSTTWVWRHDARLSTRFTEPGYPDDVQVVFPNPDSARGAQHEVMWVSIISYDRTTDRFLGTLLNEPRFLSNVRSGDNVEFGWNARVRVPYAVRDAAGSYASGWPDFTQAKGPDSTLREGIRNYRWGANGHNEPGIVACIATLTPLRSSPRPRLKGDGPYLLNFVLGRCSAEKYNTLAGVAAFREAVALAPDSIDAHMGLLAEYSILAHSTADMLKEGTPASWEAAFVEELALIRRRFSREKETLGLLDRILSVQTVDTLTLSPEERARSRRIGYAVLRWKQR